MLWMLCLLLVQLLGGDILKDLLERITKRRSEMLIGVEALPARDDTFVGHEFGSEVYPASQVFSDGRELSKHVLIDGDHQILR